MKTETVVLLHGIARTKRCMNALEKALLNDGYQVLNIDYPSRKKRISELASIILEEINRSPKIGNNTIHFVAYSMGCLILRELLAKSTIINIGNNVMLAPPNHGSEVADFLKDNYIYKHFYGPAGQELTTEYARKTPFPKMQQAFGVIAGNVCLDPLSYFILPKGNDGKVTIESTKLEGMTDHIILPCSHTFIMSNPALIKQVKYFLKHRTFFHG
jgi:hypothetical protein